MTRTITSDGLCTGCGLCQSIAGQDTVQVALTDAGYLRPTVRSPIPADRLAIIQDACPGLRVKHDLPAAEAVEHHVVWGPLVKVRTGFANRADVRHQGSSGGVITGLLVHLLETRAVDYVVQIGPDPQQPLRNIVWVNQTTEQVIRCAGSRYAPSAPLVTINQLLNQEGTFAFVGKPCDVSALRRYARHDPRVDQKVRIMLSFMCAGIPSTLGTDELVRRMGHAPEEVERFRYRGEGWPGYAKLVTRDGRSAQMSYNDSWGNVLARHLQFRCKVCPDGTGEFADVVCADAWYGGDKGYPDFSERDGRSLILTRTAQGERLVLDALAAGRIEIDNDALPADEIRKMQPFQYNRKTSLVARLWAMRAVGMRLPDFDLPRLRQAARLRTFRYQFTTFLGTLKRLLRRPPSVPEAPKGGISASPSA